MGVSSRNNKPFFTQSNEPPIKILDNAKQRINPDWRERERERERERQYD